MRYSTKQGTLNRPIAHVVHLHSVPFFGCEQHTDSGALGSTISKASVCYGDYRVSKYLLRPHFVLQPVWGCGDLGCLQLP